MNSDQLTEFEQFMHLKYVNPLQLRHTKDHIELTRLQIKILNKMGLAEQSSLAQTQKEGSVSSSSTSSLSGES